MPVHKLLVPYASSEGSDEMFNREVPLIYESVSSKRYTLACAFLEIQTGALSVAKGPTFLQTEN